MLVLSLSTTYKVLGMMVIFIIMFMYVKNIRRELYEDMQPVAKKKEQKPTSLSGKDEENDEIELIMAAAAYYYQTK